MSYQDIAVKYGTDKATHGYMPFYEQQFEYAISLFGGIDSILEIGCKEGASLRMWREIFPDTILYTLDLFKEYGIPSDIPNLVAYTGSQTDGVLLNEVRKKRYKVIIDDGSHNSRDQLITFYGLVQQAGVYIVEDLHCCEDDFYRQGMSFEQTMLGQMKAGTFPFRYSLSNDKIAFIYGTV